MVTTDAIRQALQCDNLSCACHRPNRNLHCPAHEDKSPSFSIAEKDGRILGHCHAGCELQAWIKELKDRGFDISAYGERHQTRRVSLGEPIGVYDYRDAGGKLIYQVCRYQNPTGKTFRQRRPDGKGGWIWNLNGVKRVPYRLPEIINADVVFICEGEKDADRLVAMGFEASTNPGGASKPGEKSKWPSEFNQYFEGKTVVIFPDNDDPGRAHALNVAQNLYGIAASVKVVALPGLAPKGDISDWISAGGTKEGLLNLTDQAPEWQPQEAPKPGPQATVSQPKTNLAIHLSPAKSLKPWISLSPSGSSPISWERATSSWQGGLSWGSPG